MCNTLPCITEHISEVSHPDHTALDRKPTAFLRTPALMLENWREWKKEDLHGCQQTPKAL